MDSFEKAFFIQQLNDWPNEAFVIGLSTQIVDPNIGRLPLINSFIFKQNVISEIDDSFLIYATKPKGINSLVGFDVYNTNLGTDAFGQTEIDFFQNSTLVWYSSSLRKNTYPGHLFNLFQLNVTPGADENDLVYYSYLLYPPSLCLKPVKLIKSGNNWQLTTSAVYTQPTTVFIKTSSLDDFAYRIHQNYMMNPPVVSAIPPNFTLLYNLCAIQIINYKPLINYTANYNPTYFSTLLEPRGSQIRPYSTAVYYNVEYYTKDENEITKNELAQDLPIFASPANIFRPTFLFNYNPFASNKQYFQLVQNIPDNVNPLFLSLSTNTVLSAVIDLNISDFKYFSNSIIIRQRQISNIVNNLTGIPDTSLRVSYIADAPQIYFSRENVQNTLISWSGPNNSPNIGIPTTTTHEQTAVWTTKYPPHYYAYKVSLSSNQFPFGIRETENLTFYLYSPEISSTTTSSTLSTYIVSDYGFLQYDLLTTSPNDYVKFEPINSDSIIISALESFYGSNLSNKYSLLNPFWIPISSGKDFIITYPSVEYGEISFAIKTTLSSVNGFLDSTKIEPITLAKGQLPKDPRDPLFIQILDEEEDYINLDSSFIISESAFPFRDLNNSFISWFTEPSNAFVSINAIDLSGNYITNITPYSAVLFNFDSQTVQVSGYGPTTTKIFLSSQKYNTTASVTSNSSLFNFFLENKFLVGPSIELNNLNITRTLQLTAAIPYKERIYQLPKDVPVYWSWSYDDVTEEDFQPIVSNYVNLSNEYTMGSENFAYLLSSLDFFINPAFSNLTPDIHKVKINVFTNATSPTISGEYLVEVDDFPDPTIFNTDFTIAYSNNSSVTIGNTRIRTPREEVITRPDSTTNNYFILSGNADILPSILVLPGGSITWRESNNVNGDVSFKTYTSGNNVNYFLNLNTPAPYKTTITLSALNCVSPGWVSAHNISTTTYFYIIPQTEFFNPLKFIIYPEYTALSGSRLTLLTNDNYTITPAPTAYANTITQSQVYIVSANKNNFNSYVYGAENFIIENLPAPSGELNVPFLDQIYSNTGLLISLSSYNNEEYQEEYGTVYTDHNGQKQQFTNTTRTARFDVYLESNKFSRAPKIVPYDTIPFSFSALNTFIDLDENKLLNIQQFFGSSNTPVQPVINEGTITYILSSDFWTSYIEVPAINNNINSILLKVGDPYVEGFLDGSKPNTLYLNATAAIPVKIFPSAFDDYDPFQYTEDRNQWTAITQHLTSNLIFPPITITAVTTSIKPEIYISSYYTTTSQPILIQFNTPSNIYNNVTHYSLRLDDKILTIPFSGSLYYRFSSDGTFYISYSSIYSDFSVIKHDLNIPITVKQEWDSYKQEDIRILDEITLELPYNLEQIEIQPNEWGDSDIFNTSLNRLYDNLEYLKSNSQTINTTTPTVYYGWVGTNSLYKAQGIRWYTETYGREYYSSPSLATNDGPSKFSNIQGVAASDSHFFVLDNTFIRAFSAHRVPIERKFSNASQISALFVSPKSLSIDKTGTSLYTVDSIKNQIFRFDLDLSFVPRINIFNILGGFGGRQDINKFNTPTEIENLNDDVFVLDYNNKCVKHYNSNLNWLHTYFIESFDISRPINISIHPTELLYVITEDYNIYIFDYLNDNPIQNLFLPEISLTQEEIVKLVFDEVGEFLYVLTKNKIYKYTATGYFMNFVNIPDSLEYTSGNSAPSRSLLFSSQNAIIKIQDIVEMFKIGQGLPTEYWSKKQILINPNEMATDFTYNLVLNRIKHNIKTFRNNLNAKFAIVSEQTVLGSIRYFTLVPILATERPTLSSLEDTILGVGVNELHIPQSINKELSKIYSNLKILNDFISIDPINVDNNSNNDEFCWSWKAAACYNLALPIIKMANINPITYEELSNNFVLTYAPTKNWGQALSNCCNEFNLKI